MVQTAAVVAKTRVGDWEGDMVIDKGHAQARVILAVHILKNDLCVNIKLIL